MYTNQFWHSSPQTHTRTLFVLFFYAADEWKRGMNAANIFLLIIINDFFDFNFFCMPQTSGSGYGCC